MVIPLTRASEVRNVSKMSSFLLESWLWDLSFYLFFSLHSYPRHSWSNEFQNLCVSMAFWDLYQTWLFPPQTVDSNSKDLVKRYALS